VSALGPQDWLGALETEFSVLAPGALGLPPPAAGPRLKATPDRSAGAYLPLLWAEGSVQLALVSDEAGCAAIARGLLGMGPAEALSPPEVADAVCEVMNILAGGVKARLRQRAALRLGLPTFFRGPVQPTDRMGVAALAVRAGHLAATLVVLHPRT